MVSLVFNITLTAETLTTLAIVISILAPRQRIWPPNDRRVWGKPLMLILFNGTAAGVILLGILDWNSTLVPTWVRIAFGLPAWLSGNFLATWAVVSLGLARTAGKVNELIRCGPYRYSRNPQYLGFILGLSGWAVLTNSALTVITVFAAFPPLILVPFAEEPWLRVHYGKEYETYLRVVPRFFSLKGVHSSPENGDALYRAENDGEWQHGETSRNSIGDDPGVANGISNGHQEGNGNDEVPEGHPPTFPR